MKNIINIKKIGFTQVVLTFFLYLLLYNISGLYNIQKLKKETNYKLIMESKNSLEISCKKSNDIISILNKHKENIRNYSVEKSETGYKLMIGE
jgi:hypothetical protein